MREVETSETSVVWPAWCYSGESTVNEDLPQRLVAAAAAAAAAVAAAGLVAQPEAHPRQNSRQHHRASSNQSRSSSASSASVSSSPSSPAASSSISPHSRRDRRREARKSITRTATTAAAAAFLHQQPSVGELTSSSAIAAALEAGSVGRPVALGGLVGLSTVPCDDRSIGAGGTTSSAAQRLLSDLVTPKRGTNDTDDDEDDEQQHTIGGGGGADNSDTKQQLLLRRRRQDQRSKLHTLDRMLSERIYDRKKYLNSPTGGGAGSGGGVGGGSTSAGAFYEKYRNGGSGDPGGGTGSDRAIESQLALIKNGATNITGGGGGSVGAGLNGVSPGAHLSAIAASIMSNGTNNNGGSSGHNSSSNSSNSSSSGDGNGALSLHGNQIGNSGSGKNCNSSSTTSTNNNNSNTNNNNINTSHGSSSIKSERFSPPTNDAQSMASRSRSVTPSSFSGTPPQTMHASDPGGFSSSISTGGLLPSPNSGSGGANSVGRPEFHTRNYSDFMRSLAAKYNNNNNNTNDVSNIKNAFLEPKMRFTQPKSYMEGSLTGKKGSPLTSTQVPNPSIMTSLFSGLPFQSAVFPPLIDMSSTQALVTLARAAKESDVHNILKADTGGGGLRKSSSSLSRGSSPPGSALASHHHFPSPFGAGYLPGLLPNHHHPLASFPTQPPASSAVTAASSGPMKSPSRAPEPSGLSTFPLDLSATTPSGSKRIKLSPTPSRHQETSPAPSSTNSQPSADSLDLKPTRKCHARVEEIAAWTVDNVCDFVASIDICAEYVQNFRDQSIDGAGLPLLTEEHLTNSLGMKLGPALKLRSMLAKKLGGPCPCALCSVPPSATPPVRTSSSGSSSSKGDTTPTNRPPSNDGSIGKFSPA
ncbi:uncharacterized transmembrane protein DDB_G0289901 [Anopheles nili]|uniref:uncharacterized transmembrane protein DDB_G0289901 n=1 Tax=Anopheles nili TaxID=185578 RepID=UPI00237C2CBA|nr:uncharacterized transmembrane protein DDB_G0289901 [Anopheles nili]